MKYILFTTILLITLSCSSQVTMTDVNKAIDSFARTLDSSVIKIINTNTSQSSTIDTLTATSNIPTVYILSLKAINNSNSNGGEIHYWEKKIIVRRNALNKMILMDDKNGDTYTEPSLRNCTWAVMYVNGRVLVKVNGLTNTNIIWTIQKEIKF